MKYLISKVLSVNFIFIATCAATANAATVTIPATAAPAPTSAQPSPKAAAPLFPSVPSAGNKITYAGPTANITEVANHIQVQAKSLTSLVTVATGLALTQPVTISIGYLSAWPTGNNRITQIYAPSSGNNFLYNDQEGDGKPRKLHMDINLSEPKPGGGVYSFNVPVDLALDPLYDVDISPLTFTLITGCSIVGADQIDLGWYAPDEVGDRYHRIHFAAQEGETFNIREFSWRRSEVSAAENLHNVGAGVWYGTTNFHPIPGFGPIVTGTGNLVPGKTHRSDPGLVKSIDDDCKATLDYTVTYQLRAYSDLTVRDHR
jgi:hypothetical protein